jgi:7-keto-8-aminopelargonate synthetase-like enzyme
MSSTHDPLGWIDSALDELDRAGLRRRLAVRDGRQTVRVVVDGRELVNFSSNDYLGLASDDRLIAAAREAAQREGWGSGASPLVSGRSRSHAELERRLAEFEGTEAALVFPSGFAANAGVIPALVEDEDAIFADAKNHASLIDGCRLSKAGRFIYPHGDCDALERLLKDAGRFRRRLIVTDTVFSMDGDLAPAARLMELARRYECMLLVDEAHATGVFGARGCGVVEQVKPREGVSPLFLRAEKGDGSRVSAKGSVPFFSEQKKGTDPGTKKGADPGTKKGTDPGTKKGADPGTKKGTDPVIRVGTLSKALGTAGGFVCGSQSLVDWLANRARTYVFSTAQPAATSAAGIAALDVVRDEPWRRTELLQRASELRDRLSADGWDVGRSSSQIIPLVIGEAESTMRLAARLRDAGYFVPGIRPPSVQEGESLLRLSLCYHHTSAMIDGLVEALGAARIGGVE